MRRLYAEFQKQVGIRPPGKPIFFASAFAGSVDNLLLPIARNLADFTFQLLYENTGERDPDWDLN